MYVDACNKSGTKTELKIEIYILYSRETIMTEFKLFIE